MAGIPVTAAMGAFTQAHPDVAVELRRIEWYDQAELLLDGTVDIGYVRLPIDEKDLRLHPLYAEPRLAVLYADHPLAGQASLSILDLADDPVIVHSNAIPAWDAFCNTDPRPDGRHPRPGPPIRTMEEKLEHVAAGRAITFLPASAATYYRRPDIVCIPIIDIPPHPVCLAHAARGHADTVEEFIHAAATTFPGSVPE
jgi:DNA-binding transcriptional LysR family regulator